MENGNGEHAAVHIPAEALPRRMSNVEVTLSWKARSGPASEWDQPVRLR